VARLDQSRGSNAKRGVAAPIEVAVREAAFGSNHRIGANSQAEARAATEAARSASTKASAEFDAGKALFEPAYHQASLDSLLERASGPFLRAEGRRRH